MLPHRSTLLAFVGTFACTPAVMAQSIRIECVTLSAGASSSGTILNLGQPLIGLSSGNSGAITLDLGLIPCLDDCAADFDMDGAVDFFDYDAFVGCFEGFACPPGRTADFDRDGATDFFDYDAFVVAFEAGC